LLGGGEGGVQDWNTVEGKRKVCCIRGNGHSSSDILVPKGAGKEKTRVLSSPSGKSSMEGGNKQVRGVKKKALMGKPSIRGVEGQKERGENAVF